MNKHRSKKLQRRIFDPPTPPTGTPPTGTPPTGTPPELTPEVKAAVEAAVKAERERLQAGYTKEIQALQAKSTLTAEERDDLNRRIADITSDKVAKETLLARENQTLKERAEAAEKARVETEGKWKGRLFTTMIDRSLLDAAATAQAYASGQVVSILRPNTSVEDILGEDGKPTGEYAVKVEIETLDPVTKKPKMVKLSPDEALKIFAEKPENFNLFKSKAIGGTGLHPRHSPDAPDRAQLAKADPKKYYELRQQEEKAKGAPPKS